MHPQVIRLMSLQSHFQLPLKAHRDGDWEMLLEDWRRANNHSSLQAEGSGKLRAGQLHLRPGECDGVINPRSHYHTHEGKESVWGSLHGFMKEKLHLSKPIASYYDITGLICEGRTVDVP